MNGAPPCSFSRTPPLELRSLNLGIKKPIPKRGLSSTSSEMEEGIAGYISFGEDNGLGTTRAGSLLEIVLRDVVVTLLQRSSQTMCKRRRRG